VIQSDVPLVMFDTNILFDFFLGRDPEILSLVQSCRTKQVVIRVPEFVLIEFRGSILRELGKMEASVQTMRSLAKEFERADHLSSGVDALKEGCLLVSEDVARRRAKLDQFLSVVRCELGFEIVPHTPEIHYRGDLRFAQGLPPDQPKRGVQDCRIFEAILEIARNDRAVNTRSARYLLTKDSDFLKQAGIARELEAVGVQLEKSAARITHRSAG
jgi:predicted nucleic acid-binding protein